MPLSETASSAPGETLADAIAGVFERIAAERMQGLAILNPRLRVEVIGLREHAGDWFAVLITPWCMNLLLVPGAASATRLGAVGSKGWVTLPGGEVEFIASTEPGVGAFAACSLFSPMGDFSDQGMAVATAEAVLQAMFEAAQPRPPQAHAGLSRRALLLGGRRTGSERQP